ncbi:MAG: branched-chain amino acid transaminase [Nitrosopumilus sp.]|uniref:branched-chain amino acid transaminase n=1 Tax=Nitrosopumilus sp. TaxID=2024843 RepID=UPI00246A04E9|nr:branched-chain amino acid transaminase [Nitrosopumilus sp.]MDH5430744.1 branched-chain amino acid transaminase [Nitrosopumilus sp.]MDH5665162.1 branched-chain amino acid transaminase [Nitrosopumilus sp.]MDH5697076.1 branched-chain amino acid transaminase [Nitrosopumilus sp.]
MQEIGKIWMNGKLVPFKDAKVHVLTHALHYSTSIFEGIRCYDTPNGSAIFRLPEHVDRFFKSAKLYSMKMQFSKKVISDAIIQTVKAGRLKESYIRPLAYYGYGTMGLTPTTNNVDVSISCWEWKMGESKAGKFSGAKCKVSSWTKIDSRSQPMQAKAASNYANAALARMEALDNGYDEAIMLNYHGKVAEGSAENIFIIKDDIIQTPPLSAGGLEGITRDSIIQMIKKNGGFVIERDLERDDLYNADEVFMTGTAAEVKSVTQIDKVKIGNGKMGSITKALQKSFSDVVMGKDERFLPWLTFI